MKTHKIRNLFVLVTAMCWFQVASAQEDDFSLGDEPLNGNSASAPINNLGDSSDLFGDTPVETPPENNKTTGLPVSGGQSANPSGINQPAVSPTPSGLGLQSPSTQPSSGSSELSPVSTGLTDPLAAPTANEQNSPLLGDGSLAPVKLEQAVTPNDFGGVPPLPGTRREMAPGEAPEFYSVEEGDTMFDVCSQLIDDGNYWPKLWSLNPDVRNPHFIYPGAKLAFYSGDQENPPYLEVVTEDEVVPVEKGPVKEVELVSEVVAEVGKPGASEEAVTALVYDAPVPVVGPSEIGSESDSLDGFIFAGRTYSSKTIHYSIPAFYFEEERSALGKIVSGVSGEYMRGDGDKIVVEPEENLGIGTYTVLRPRGPVYSRATGDKVGYRYDFSGNLKITKQNRSGLFEGDVFGARGGVAYGDIVVEFLATKRSLPEQMVIGQINTANSSVIGFEEAYKQVGAMGDFVFLEKEGLSVGASYAIYRKDNTRDIRHIRNKDLSGDGFGVAVVKVLEINGQGALGYIVSSNSETRVGDTLAP
jgi:hypothetical protein